MVLQNIDLEKQSALYSKYNKRHNLLQIIYMVKQRKKKNIKQIYVYSKLTNPTLVLTLFSSCVGDTHNKSFGIDLAECSANTC